LALQSPGRMVTELWFFPGGVDLHEPTVALPAPAEGRQPAESQEIILAAFEEDGWPRRIDDPRGRPDVRLDPAVDRATDVAA
jgi:hypothetical protein